LKPKAAKAFTRWQVLTVWFLTIVGLGLCYAVIPILFVLPLIVRHFPEGGSPKVLAGSDLGLVIIYALATIVGSVACGGGLKLATSLAPARYSVALLILVLIVLGYLGDAAIAARSVFSSLSVVPRGETLSRQLAFLEGAWAVSYFGLFLVLTGWSLKAPWDRCAQRISDLLACFFSSLNARGKVDEVGTPVIIAAALAVTGVPAKVIPSADRDQPLAFTQAVDPDR